MNALPYYEILLAIGSYVVLLSFLHFSVRLSPRLFRLKATIFAFIAGLVVMCVAGGRLLARAQGSEDGLVFFGALIGGLIFCLLFAKASRRPLLEILDRLAPGLALGHAVGRIGCFIEGCCYGAYCDLPWAVEDSQTHMPIHPVQLYEAFALLVLGVLLWRSETRRLRGAVRPHTFGVYLLSYAVLRFVLEYFRGDLIRGIWGPFSTSQWISLALIPFALAALYKRRPPAKP